MQRSTFLRLSALVAVGLGIPFTQSCANKPFNRALGQPFFLSHIFEAKTMKETGQAYLLLAPGENNSSKLATQLTAGTPITAATSANTVNDYFDLESKSDFTNNRTVVVEGWILAVTEARQCALFSLTQA